MTMVFGASYQRIIEYVHTGFHTYLTIIWLFLTLMRFYYIVCPKLAIPMRLTKIRFDSGMAFFFLCNVD